MSCACEPSRFGVACVYHEETLGRSVRRDDPFRVTDPADAIAWLERMREAWGDDDDTRVDARPVERRGTGVDRLRSGEWGATWSDYRTGPFPVEWGTPPSDQVARNSWIRCHAWKALQAKNAQRVAGVEQRRTRTPMEMLRAREEASYRFGWLWARRRTWL